MGSDSEDDLMDLDQHQHKCFDVGYFDPTKVDLSKLAMTADGYLKQVIVGRSQLPHIVVASNYNRIMAESPKPSTSHVTRIFAEHSASNEFQTRFGPDQEWRTAKINEFSLHRSLMEGKSAPCNFLMNVQLPSIGDSFAWGQVCFERRLPGFEISDDEENNDNECRQQFAHHKGTPPTLGLVLSLGDNLVNNLILHVIEYIIEHGHTRASLEWMFALMLVVKKPLLHDVCSALRDFCRKCREWRSQLDEDELDLIYELSWFITMISSYFAQRDLAD